MDDNSSSVSDDLASPGNNLASSTTAAMSTEDSLLQQLVIETMFRPKPPSRTGVKTFFGEDRHKQRKSIKKAKLAQWRMKERLKTVHVALVMCLNIGVDPPDMFKVLPSAKLECWIDPFSLPPAKALETIGNQLKVQYERWQPRARYKQCLDPTLDDVKKTCQLLRRSAKDERVLFHYNGHGVPRPTVNGEVWVFNKTFTQYIPLSVYDLNMWMGSPSIYVFDCSAAGIIVNTFLQLSEQREGERASRLGNAAASDAAFAKREVIILASCSAGDTLPMNPDFPADLFTACLTTPIKIALEWFCKHNRLLGGISRDLIKDIPGKINERRSPLGELNWIFTAITDTIAWNVLPRDLFQRLFRQDLLVASLFRNFLLAERIMHMANCTPVTYPALPPAYNHPMWQSWDLAVDMCLSQLPTLISNPTAEFKYSTFFSEQLTAFEVWLNFGNEYKRPPEQLPIVLQVLLSQTHRLRALTLLGRFLDMGPWAVNLALSVGIFPYVLKLLQTHASDLRQILVFIWTKILALDKSCQTDLVKENGHIYFKNVLTLPPNSANLSLDSRMKAMTCFILSVIVDDFPQGQAACMQHDLLKICLAQLRDSDSLLRRWALLCVAKLLKNNEEAKSRSLLLLGSTITQLSQIGSPSSSSERAPHHLVIDMLTDPVPEVRAAAVCALSNFVLSSSSPISSEGRSSFGKTDDLFAAEMQVGSSLFTVISDGSPMVRKELVYALAIFIRNYQDHVSPSLFKAILDEERNVRESQQVAATPASNTPSGAFSGASGSQKQSKKKSKNKTPTSEGNSIPTPMSPISPQHSTVSPTAAPFGAANMTPTEMSGNPLNARSFFVLDMIRVTVLLTSDPIPEVSESAQRVIDYLTKLMTDQSTPTTPLSSKQSKTGSAIFSQKQAIPRSTSISDALRDQGAKRMSSSSISSFADDASMSPTPPQPDVDILPVSTFYEWSAQYFSKPMLQDEDETGPLISQRRWRQKRNERIAGEAQLHYRNAANRRLEEQIALIGNETDCVSQMRFHPFEPLLLVADGNDGISVWNWEQATRINLFYCKRLNGHITSMNLINEHDASLLMTASISGNVLIYKDYFRHNAQKIVSGFKAVDATINAQGPGIVTEWQQEQGLLHVAGPINTVRIWDVEHELCVQSVDTQTDTFVSSLACNRIGGHTVVAGCGDGSIRIFDRRTPNEHSLVQQLKEHQHPIVNVSMQKNASSTHQVISGSTSGDIKFWDIRTGASLRTIDAHRTPMTALAVHDYAPILASGSNNQFVKVFNTAGETLSMIYYHDGFLGSRIGPVSCLSFHPHKLCLAAGATDAIISIWASSGSSPAS